MRLPTVQSVERAMTRCGARLRYGLRFIMPPAAFFCALAFFGERYRSVVYPFMDEPRLFYLKAMDFARYLTALGLAMCLVAALCTIDPKVRRERPLVGQLLVLTIVFFTLMLIPTIQ